MTTLIIGAGIAGVCLAWELAALEEQVIVVDRCKGPAGEASHANTGMITPSQSAPWAGPGMPLIILNQLLNRDSHLKLRLGGLPWAFGWGLWFLRNCTEENRRRAFSSNFRLAAFSRDRLIALRSELNLAYDHTSVGTLRVFWTRAAFEAGRRAADDAMALGTPARPLARDESISLDPTLAALGERLAGTLHFPADETGDCARFAELLSERARQKGVSFRWQTQVLSLELTAGRVVGALTNEGRISADRFVIAAGPSSPDLVEPLGIVLPIAPVKGYSITADRIDPGLMPRIPRIDESRAIGITPMGQRLRVGGFIELAGFDTRSVASQIDRMRRSAIAACPTLEGELRPSAVESWACLRPLTADGPPILGETPVRNLFLNTGHGSMGWTMGCGSAAVVAAIMAGRKPPIDVCGLTLERFAR